MRRQILRAILTIAMVISFEAANAESQDADLACFIALISVYNSDNAQLSDSALAGGMYYLGKLEGTMGFSAASAKIMEEAPKFDQAKLGPTLVRCGGELKVLGDAMQAMAQQMLTDGK